MNTHIHIDKGPPFVTVAPELAISASANMPLDCRGLCSIEPFQSTLLRSGYRSWEDLPRGQVLCLTELTNIFSTDRDALPSSAWERAFGNYEPHRFFWQLDRVFALPTGVPVKSNRLIFNLPDDVAMKVRDAIMRNRLTS